MPLAEGARWLWVSQPAGRRNGRSWPAATFALAVKDGVVVEASPIARRSVGRRFADVAAFYRNRGAEFRDLGQGAPPAGVIMGNRYRNIREQ